MSSSADVTEMQSTFEQLATLLAPRASDRAAATALHREFRDSNQKPLFTWNRVFELLKGRARRVDGWEKDFAKQRLAQLKEGTDHALEKSQANYRLLETRLAALEELYSRIDPEHAREYVAAFRSQAR